MNKKVVAAAVAVLGLIAGSVVISRRTTTASVEVAPGPIQESAIGQGEVVASAGNTEVRALVDGRVVEVAAREGDLVVTGQLLARLGGAEVDAAIARAEAERAVARAELQLARSGGRQEDRVVAEAALDAARAAMALETARAARDSDLAGRGTVSEQIADQSRRSAEVARAAVVKAEAERKSTLVGRPEMIEAAKFRLAAAEASLAAAVAKRDRAVISAPISGVVLSRSVSNGDSVIAGAKMFELADPAATELLVEVEDHDAMRVAPGLAVTITLPGGLQEIGRGTLDRLSPRLGHRVIGSSDARLRGETRVRSAWVRWTTPNPQPIGFRVEARIALPAMQVSTRVPRSAIEIRDGHARVQVLRNVLLRDTRPVELGIADTDWVEVKGIERGTRIAEVAR